jgi:LacI family transcriptional regulator
MAVHPKPDIAMIAQKANVPVTTVLRVLYGHATRLEADEFTRICAAIEAVGHVAFSAQGSQPTGATIGVMMPGVFNDNRANFNGHVLEGVTSATERLSYSVILHFPHHNAALGFDVSGFLKHVNGIVLIGGNVHAGDFVKGCLEQNLPFVLVESDYPKHHNLGVSISADNRSGMEQAVHHLVNLGHRRIGFITGKAGHPSAQERLDAYRSTLRALNIPAEDGLVSEGDWLEDSGYSATQQLLSLLNPPTAIIASNDMMALGVYRAATEAGLEIGRDLSVIGFDNIPITEEISPPLTTVQQPLHEMGQRAVEHLGRLLTGEQMISRDIRVPTSLLVRASTQRSRAG